MTTNRYDESIIPIITPNIYPIITLTKDNGISTDNKFTLNNSNIIINDKKVIQSTTNNVLIKSTGKGIFHQILLTTAVLILAAGCGMPIGYSAILLPQLYKSNDSLSMDIEMGSWFASVHSLATPIGSFASGPVMDHFGRRPTLMFTVIPLLLGWTLLATASSHALLLLGRIIAGISVGLTAAPAQILIAECAEPHLRGVLVGVPFVSYSLGILFVYALGALLHWRLVAWCGIILPLLAITALFFVPESPAWLARMGFIEKASKALRWLRGNDMLAKDELNELVLRFDREKESSTANESLYRSCIRTAVLKPLFIINGFHFFLTLSGTYLVVFYAVDIVSELGGNINSMSAAVITAIVRLLFTIVFCFMLLYVNRRKMIIISGIGSTISSFALGVFLYWRLNVPKTVVDLIVSAICIFIYIGSNTGFMVMPGIMVGELLPAKIRGRIAGYLFTLLNIAIFFIAKLFPYMKHTLNTYGLFLLFGFGSFGATILMYFMLPETKGKSLGEIEDYFQQQNWIWLNSKNIKSNDIDVDVDVIHNNTNNNDNNNINLKNKAIV